MHVLAKIGTVRSAVSAAAMQRLYANCLVSAKGEHFPYLSLFRNETVGILRKIG